MNNNDFDSIIIGSGISGLSLALKLANNGQSVFIASKEAITEGSSKYAQGGVAVYSPENTEDDLESHIQDTLDSGKGICNEEIVREILSKGWAQIQEIQKLGLDFDKGFNIEGSHSYSRVMHVADGTGRAILKPLVDHVSRHKNISISQGSEAISLIKSDSRVVGARFSSVNGDEYDIFSKTVILCSGGYAALYEDFTCPNILTGDGLSLAYEAGAKLENLEFVQFHPTVFKSPDAKNFLISETLRGAGAVLRNVNGDLFAHKYHKDAELATRDIVSRAIHSEMKVTESDFVYIDATEIDKEILLRDFPNIFQYLANYGYNLGQDLVPIRPAAHYSIGGIKVDLQSRTNVPGLYAIGECASNGLHGANRLASNSLLECLVVPELSYKTIIEENLRAAQFDEYEYCSDYFVPVSHEEINEHAQVIEQIRSVMSKNLSVERRQKSLQASVKFLEGLDPCKEQTAAYLVAKSALQRKESRGVHFRVDSPRSAKALERSTILSKEAKTIRAVKINETSSYSYSTQSNR